MDDAMHTTALRSFVRCRSLSERPVVAAVMVHDRPRRRLDRVSRFAAKGHWRTNDFLAGSAALGSNYFFCDLLLSRKCRGILESGLAASRRSGRARFYAVVPSRHARIVDERVYSDSCRSCGLHVANGPTDRAFVVYRPLRETWTNASTKTFAH